jgi:xylulokinase
VADVIGHPLEAPRETAGSALGAAFAAGMGVGLFEAWSEIDRFVALAETVEPDGQAHARYDEIYPLYRELYPVLRPILHRTSAWGGAEPAMAEAGSSATEADPARTEAEAGV